MKTRNIIIIIVGILLLLILFLIIKLNSKSPKEISNITYLRFSYTTGNYMNANIVYEINLKNGKYIAKIKPSGIKEEDAKEVKISNEKMKEIEKTLNEYNISRWNGFNKSDKYVLDGSSFSMSIKLKNDKYISASGYMRWPNNYKKVRSYLDDTLGSLYKE